MEQTVPPLRSPAEASLTTRFPTMHWTKRTKFSKETLDDFMRELPIIVRTLGPGLYGEVERLLRDHPDKVSSARPLLVEAATRLAQQMNTVARMLMRERPEFGRKILERKHENTCRSPFLRSRS